MSVHQVIIVVKDLEPMQLVRMSVRAGMEIMNQFDPTRTAYAGSHEHKNFNAWFDEWIEAGSPQNIYVADESAGLDEVEFHANLEGAPTNFIQDGSNSTILVVGPFDSARLNYYTQNCKPI
ncbi:hypothetical protein pEaSNUABM50_00192 [Erwinia phage pEa_SNUABM_50]|uniref:Uncharacterized protein n=4 Tax=Eneladusvirus BF TaxID=2560751 RepID=A0A7L8ZN17_9CAUD|nr:hypothetical protein FDH34_gp196 [Serratia phage BF]QOI71133.1 hypothetical protein pEaSNUABM12_00195 [Erwinia phage pEa_SNUABM_12]QOI71677.1 hypothetical protein pEaSNUABM47_00193 [Erwinia phage pEa_SNUABM_47]QOI72216.1 hypothetical protein pEaSNUABM50_00192 [Erwinia phage pEa_SNUABM_50]QXO11342.1 hypothetical protein pEaSNUABM19_00196 [Erwinia phage pEa_SNUABM_19]QXO11890.1 hypothetical protein pEaSNUABM44_00194 [Erwinia phage pEa_SNUABM_44]QXO12442.1 hypothetical protein pEaSNUABM49_001